MKLRNTAERSGTHLCTVEITNIMIIRIKKNYRTYDLYRPCNIRNCTLKHADPEHMNRKSRNNQHTSKNTVLEYTNTDIAEEINLDMNHRSERRPGCEWILTCY
jgi:hypothetical protein